MADTKESFQVEEVEVDADSDDDFRYEEVDVEDPEEAELEEDLDTALQTLKAKTSASGEAPPQPAVQKRPETVDDFIRNFLHRSGLVRTLDVFQTEWYEMRASRKAGDALEAVPDAYLHIQQLEEENARLRAEAEKLKELAGKARGMWDKLRKERDHHRMHHRRVVQEKDKLVTDLRRLKTHVEGYEPLLKELQRKYEAAMKEKMLVRLERDRMAQKLETALEQLKQMGGAQPAAEETSRAATDSKARRRSAAREAVLPADDRDNPYQRLDFDPTPADKFSNVKTYKGHIAPIAGMALHPKKPLLATCSDDATWKLWALANGELLMSGEGHRDWIGDIDFHPQGTHVVTGSGDSTIKLWEFASASCVATLTDHSVAVWSVAFHDTGDFVASASMDHTARLFDILVGKCKQTFRGHVDAVNRVTFQPFTNTLATCSGDKTVSLWDARSGLCVQTFYGHNNAVDSVTFNNRGDTLASTDSDGVLKLWDVRMVRERAVARNPAGRYPANRAGFDRSGKVVAVGYDDCVVRTYDASDGKLLGELRGHEDGVRMVLFDPSGKTMYTCGDDCTFRIWQ